MTNAHKIVLSLIATVCLTLIVFYSVKGNSQQPAGAPPSMAVIERTPRTPGQQPAATTPASPATSVIVGPTATTNATGLDDLVARVRSEVAVGDTPATSQPGTLDDHADLSASSNAAATASPVAPTADSTANNHSPFDLQPRADTAIDSSVDPSVDSSTSPYTGPVEPDRFAANAPAGVDLEESEVPSFTLGQPLEEPLIAGDSPSDLEPTDLPKLPDIDETVTPSTGSNTPDDAGHSDVRDGYSTATPDTPETPETSDTPQTPETATSDTALSRDPFGSPRLFGVDPTPAREDRFAANSGARAPAESRPTGPWQPPRDETPARSDSDTTSLNTTNSATPKTYTIKAGDSFSSIATAIFGAEKHWIDIADANPKVDPKRIKIGQVINLPDLQKDDQSSAAAPPVAPAAPSAPAPPRDREATPAQPAAPAERIHEVKAGENLSSISRRYYNTPDHWRHLYLTNRDLIGSNPGKLQAGTKLKITTPPKD